MLHFYCTFDNDGNSAGIRLNISKCKIVFIDKDGHEFDARNYPNNNIQSTPSADTSIEYRELSDYETIQNEFPLNYGLEGVPKSAFEKRKKQVKDIKAYLLIFDQLLTNYMKQLDGFKYLFSFNHNSVDTYFSQKLPDSAWNSHFPSLYNETISILRRDEEKIQRKNRILNHLLAVFSDNFITYSSMNMTTNEQKKVFLNEKSEFLNNLSEIRRKRSNVESIKDMIFRKTGLGLSDFHLIEHILMYPDPNSDLKGDDQYSFKLSVVLKETSSFSVADSSERKFLEKILDEELPVHISFDLVVLTESDFTTLDTNVSTLSEPLSSQEQIKTTKADILNLLSIG